MDLSGVSPVFVAGIAKTAWRKCLLPIDTGQLAHNLTHGKVMQ
jgi:hypothetical protein